MNHATHSDLVAIDFVLVPQGKTWESAIQWNRNHCDEKIRLGFRQAPHLSLLMCYVNASDLDAILGLRNRLQESNELLNLANLKLRTKNLSLVDVGKDRPIVSWGIEKSQELLRLQENLISNFRSYFQDPIRANTLSDAFYGKVEDSTVEWTSRYLERSTGSHFDPHITLGFWNEKSDLPIPESSLAEWQKDSMVLSVFQLGNHCTCRNRLKQNFNSDLIAAYTNTNYNVGVFPGQPIRIGDHHPFIDKILEERNLRSWAYTTAWNPYSINLTKNGKNYRNFQRNNVMETMIQEEGWFCLEGVGEDASSNWYEESFLILGIGEEDARLLSAFWEQNAFVYGEIGDIAQLII